MVEGTTRGGDGEDEDDPGDAAEEEEKVDGAAVEEAHGQTAVEEEDHEFEDPFCQSG